VTSPFVTPPRQQTNVFQQGVGSHVDNVVNQYGMQAAGKKITVHDGAGYRLETDGPYPDVVGGNQHSGVMDLEFVTQPFEETETGRKGLQDALRDMATVTRHDSAHHGQDEAQGEFVTPSQHGLSNTNIYLASGKANPRFKVQVTQGLNLRDIPLLMEHLGSNVADETQKLGAKRLLSRDLVRREDQPVAPGFQEMGSAPAYARQAIGSLGTVLTQRLHRGLGDPIMPLSNVGSWSQTHPAFVAALRGLTIGAWIDGIIVDGTDRLTASAMLAYAQQQGQAIPQYEKSTRVFLRGHGGSKSLSGDVEKLAILENRDIDLGYLDMGEAAAWANAYLDFIIRLKWAEGQERRMRHG
jgi:hypothetical protein